MVPVPAGPGHRGVLFQPELVPVDVGLDHPADLMVWIPVDIDSVACRLPLLSIILGNTLDTSPARAAAF